MKEAIYVYKCRRCGEIDRSMRSCQEKALTTAFEIVMNKPYDQRILKGHHPMLIDIHHCKDHNIGVTDFIGVEFVET